MYFLLHVFFLFIASIALYKAESLSRINIAKYIITNAPFTSELSYVIILVGKEL
jgi:hypothetical protein